MKKAFYLFVIVIIGIIFIPKDFVSAKAEVLIVKGIYNGTYPIQPAPNGAREVDCIDDYQSICINYAEPMGSQHIFVSSAMDQKYGEGWTYVENLIVTDSSAVWDTVMTSGQYFDYDSWYDALP
jgi:hypothetical protein